MAVYFIFLCIAAAGCILLDFAARRHIVGNLPKAQLIWIGLLLFILSALRGEQVGVDVRNYHLIFNTFGTNPLSARMTSLSSGYPGYRLICRIVYILTGGSYRVMLALSAAVIIYGFFKFFYLKSDNCLMSAAYFVFMYFFFSSLNVTRQFMAMAVMLLAFLALDEKKRLKFVLLAAFAVSIHNVCILMLIYPILARIKWTKLLFAGYCVLITAGLLFAEYAIRLFVAVFPRYSFYAVYNWQTTRGRRTIAVSLVLLATVLLALILSSPKLFGRLGVSPVRCTIRTFSEPLWTFMSLTMIEIVMGIFYFDNSFYIRIQSFFTPFAVLFLPGFIERVNKKWRFWLYLGSNAIFISITSVRLLLLDSGVVPYRFFWQ